MRIRLLWRRTAEESPARQRERFRKAILKAAGLDHSVSMPIEEVLRLLPIRQGNPPCGPPGGVLFRHPSPAPSRTAVLDPRLRSCSGVRIFDDWKAPALYAWSPDSLAAPVRVLLDIVAAGASRLALRQALIAFTGLADPSLQDDARRLLWRTFGVPVFEQFRASGGQLLAGECEAHEGLHISVDRAHFELDPRAQGPELLVSYLNGSAAPVLRLATGLTAEIAISTCACGVDSPRLIDIRKRVTRRLLERAAGAA